MRAHAARLVVSAAAVALVTGAIFALNYVAPILSLGVLYIFAVLPIAVFYGLGYALGVSIASMLAFNFFFLPPLHSFALTDSENWVALAVYLVTAVVVSELAAVSRRRAQAAAEAATKEVGESESGATPTSAPATTQASTKQPSATQPAGVPAAGDKGGAR